MKFVRFVIPAALTLLATSVVAPNMAVAQGYGNAPRDSRDSRDGRDNGNDLQGNGNAPIMAARTWHTVERAGDTWDGLWTFDDRRHRTISATWVDRETGARISAPRMIVRQRGQQIVITRPGTGDYVGTLSADGTSLRGTMSWVQGNFTARIPRQ
jgi:hypothetical protein